MGSEHGRVLGDAGATSLRPRPNPRRVMSAVLLGALMLSAATAAVLDGPQEVISESSATSAAFPPIYPGGRNTPSNITPESYVGPEACARCHRENYQSWLEHPHRRMNQLASDDSVLGDFHSRTVRIGAGTARFERDANGAFMLTLERAG